MRVAACVYLTNNEMKMRMTKCYVGGCESRNQRSQRNDSEKKENTAVVNDRKQTGAHRTARNGEGQRERELSSEV